MSPALITTHRPKNDYLCCERADSQPLAENIPHPTGDRLLQSTWVRTFEVMPTTTAIKRHKRPFERNKTPRMGGQAQALLCHGLRDIEEFLAIPVNCRTSARAGSEQGPNQLSQQKTLVNRHIQGQESDPLALCLGVGMAMPSSCVLVSLGTSTQTRSVTPGKPMKPSQQHVRPVPYDFFKPQL